MANKGEWGEPYAAIRMLGDGKLYIADQNGNRNPHEWMQIIKLTRHESRERIVSYHCNPNNMDIEVFVNGNSKGLFESRQFSRKADILASEIKNGRGRSFNVSNEIQQFLTSIEMKRTSAMSIEKSDIFLTVNDPRAAIIRENVGFSIKSEFGNNPTLFNTAKASAPIYKLSNMDDTRMDEVNNIFDDKGKVAVGSRCDKLREYGCEFTFIGFPVAQRAGCVAFQENLDLIDQRLPYVIERMLRNHFINHDVSVDINDVTNVIVEQNPCNISRPEIKYPYMMKSFLYATYCGMTASTLWDGKSQVNGGFIKVDSDGNVLAHYALESDAFKTYLYDNCYLEFPATSENHGNYAKVYKENDDYFFRLNFQIRYR